MYGGSQAGLAFGLGAARGAARRTAGAAVLEGMATATPDPLSSRSIIASSGCALEAPDAAGDDDDDTGRDDDGDDDDGDAALGAGRGSAPAGELVGSTCGARAWASLR